MAQPRPWPVWVCLACLLFLNGCKTEPRLKYKILHLENVTWACNISTSSFHFGVASELEEKKEVRIPASKGDLLYIVNENDKELYYRYDPEAGDHLVVSQDTLKSHLIFINGNLAQIELSSDFQWEELGDDLLTIPNQPLSTLYIRDSLSDEMILKLKKYPVNLDGTGVFFESDVSSGPFGDLITFCKPAWMAIEFIPFNEEAEQERILDNLELLWITGDPLTFAKIEQHCNNLESLIISDWKPGGDDLVPLSGLKKFHALTLADCSISDLSVIEFPTGLKQLNLDGCDTLTDITGISSMPHLRSLGLAGCTHIASMEPVKAMHKLERIGFPENTSQEDFTTIVGYNQSLEVVELIECAEVKDVSPLKDLENLDILVLQLDTALPEQLGSLDQLELIILDKKIFDKSPERIAALRAQLPNTTIVPGSGLCLGSGWLLLILPVVLVSRLLLRRK
jgi:hypothetical protein